MKSNPKQPGYKKSVWPPKNAVVKKDVESKSRMKAERQKIYGNSGEYGAEL